MTNFPKAQKVDVGGATLAVHEAGVRSDRPSIILVHGWPEIAYSWKNQINVLAEAGFHVLAPDLRGFGGSDAPKEKDAYDIRQMTNDLKGLLDAFDIEKAVFCGHDWGGALVWPMAILHPNRVAGVIGVCTQHRAPPPVPPLDIVKERFGERHYFITFQEPGAAEAHFTGHEEKFFRMLFRRPAPRAIWPKLMPHVFDLLTLFENFEDQKTESCLLSDADLAVYVEAFKVSGFHGGVNLYRNINANYEIMKSVDPVISQPSLWIGADLDMFLPPEAAADMEAIIPDLEKHIIPECGHWVMWEKPNELNALLVDWLKRRF